MTCEENTETCNRHWLDLHTRIASEDGISLILEACLRNTLDYLTKVTKNYQSQVLCKLEKKEICAQNGRTSLLQTLKLIDRLICLARVRFSEKAILIAKKYLNLPDNWTHRAHRAD